MSSHHSTPRKVHEPADVTNLESVRDHIVEEERDRLQSYPPDQFLGRVLPGVTDEELRRVKVKLKIKDSAAWINQRMGGAKPSCSGLTEAAAFHNITTIFNEVAKAVKAVDICRPLIRAEENPARSPEGDVKYNTKPDGYDVLEKTQHPGKCDPVIDRLGWGRKREKLPNVSWVNIAGTKEYKLVSNPKNQQDVCLLFSTLYYL